MQVKCSWLCVLASSDPAALTAGAALPKRGVALLPLVVAPVVGLVVVYHCAPIAVYATQSDKASAALWNFWRETAQLLESNAHPEIIPGTVSATWQPPKSADGSQR